MPAEGQSVPVAFILQHWRALAVGAAVLALLTFAGWEKLRADHLALTIAEAGRKQAEHAVKLQTRQAEVSDKVGAKAAEAVAKVETRTRTLIREVPVYVTPEADRLYRLPVGWVRLHDAQVLSVPADPPGPADAEPSDVAASQALATVLDNYGSCQADQERLKALQAWITEQRAVDMRSRKVGG
jgi:hypothetical protein